MSTYVVGDIHGCGHELSLLIEQVGDSHRWISVGDCFDRGTHADLVWRMIDKYDIQVVMGNHELKMLKYLRGERNWLPPNYHWALDKLIGGDRPLLTRAGLTGWLESLPQMLHLKELNALVVHGGVAPDPLEPCVSWNVYGRPPLPEGRKRNPKEDNPPWWHDYAGTLKVVYGHTVSGLGHPRMTYDKDGDWLTAGIDTGACHGGPLTAICLESGVVTSVRSHEDWHNKLLGFLQDRDPLQPWPYQRGPSIS